MRQFTQLEIVQEAIYYVLSQRDIVFILNGKNIASDLLTPEDIHKVKEVIFELYKQGYMKMRVPKDDDEMKIYIRGLLNNHLRKSKSLNANKTYEPVKKSSDSYTMIALKKLLKTLEIGSDQYEQVLKSMEQEQNKTNNEVELSLQKRTAS